MAEDKPERSRAANVVDGKGSEGEDSSSSGVLLDMSLLKQTENWDCGIACCAMALRYYGQDVSLKTLKVQSFDIGMTKSTWTVELCYLLHLNSVRNRYHTSSICVNPELGKEDYYAKSFVDDTARINKLFDRVNELGLQVSQREPPLEDLVAHLDQCRPLIVLVNAMLLTCKHCAASECAHSADSRSTAPYLGHYIVVIGCDQSNDVIHYLDPSPRRCNHPCSITVKIFEEARAAFGTDLDTIFLDGCLASVP
ncbi:protein GUCD1-like isoform X1 [Sycon ciliatum]|uniref:protein GUCD1-like isoform X1 n=1 Tax=Sycon ciliatum TaxID=27933 RepID=UPI0031F6B4E3